MPVNKDRINESRKSINEDDINALDIEENTQIVNEEQTNVDDFDIDEMLENAEVAEAKQGNRVGKNVGFRYDVGIDLIHHRCGHRIKFTDKAFKLMGGKLKQIQVKLDVVNGKMYLAEEFSNEQNTFYITEKAKNLFYCGPLTKEIVEKFNLNYENISTRCYPVDVVQSSKGYPIAIVDLARGEKENEEFRNR
jgi:tetrahydromethanopterin S-methyltransferase subunit G